MADTPLLGSSCYWCSTTVMPLWLSYFLSQGGGRGSPWRMTLKGQNMGHRNQLLGPKVQAHRQEHVVVRSWLLDQHPSCRRGEKGECC